ncbi:MAG TPA: ribulose-phosphate 3-epimerase [Sedimentisphaerales bacterium]|jgi:ribulose-phosphate 3-epimerase|nr:ribulose-phosphate 3-epimerase [Sedimentisphaerales bacterium]HNU31741.1 ribulose-phosphate 3-epimerase [Sedimentisphaerales bacterium]
MNRALPSPGTVEIAPSILSADFAKLADEIASVTAAGVKMLHLDVMDGHFVPNLTIGPVVIAKLRKHSGLFFDSHLMISEPARYIEAFAKAGVDNITFHIEVTDEPERMIDRIHDLGCTAGITLNPETPVESIAKVAPLCDMVLVMTVRPGFGGQEFMEDAARKVIAVREMVGPGVRVEVDGGIDARTTPIVVSYGADTLVAGNAIFGKSDRLAAIRAIRDACEQRP